MLRTRASYGGSNTSAKWLRYSSGVLREQRKELGCSHRSTSINTQSAVLFVMDDSKLVNSNGSDMTGDSSALYWGTYYNTANRWS